MFNRIRIVLLVSVLVMVCFSPVQAQQKIDPSFQIKNTTLAAGEAMVGASTAAVLTNKTVDGDDNTLQDLALSTLKTVIGDATKFIIRDATGAVISSKTVPLGDVVGLTDSQALTNKTLTDATNHISGTVVDSGTVAEARIDAAIARDIELPNNASFTFEGLSDTDTYAAQGGKTLRVKATADGIEYYTPAAGEVFSQEDSVIGGVATTTITLSVITISSLAKTVIYVNGVAQKNANFTLTNSTHLDSTVGTLPPTTDIKVCTHN